MPKIDQYTELCVKMEYLSNSIVKMDDTLKDVLLEQRITGALVATQREALNNTKQILDNTAAALRKEMIVNNELQSNKIKVFLFSGLIGFAIMVSKDFIIQFIKNLI